MFVYVFAMSGLMLCPRCGLPIKSIYAYEAGSNTYYYAYHGNGRKCYLGPFDYVYVTMTHEFRIHGAVDVDRELKYLSNVMDVLVKAVSTGKIGGKNAINVLTEILDAAMDLAEALMESSDEEVRNEVKALILDKIETLRKVATE